MRREIEADIAEQPAVVGRALSANRARLEEARALLEGRSLVRFVGIGSSRHAAGYGAVAMETITGRPCAVPDAPGAGVPPPAWRPEHAAVAFSQSGETPALLDAVAVARSHRAPVIAIVNGADSGLADLADVVLTCEAGDERVVAATKTVTAQLVLARALAAPIDPAGHHILDAAITAALGTPVDAPSAYPSAVVAAGPASGWLADEIALKFAEVAGWTVAAEPLVEHLHGPIAATGHVLAFVNGDDPNLPALLAGRPPLVRAGTDAHAAVCIPSTGDPLLDVPVRLVVGQRLVVAWAERAGEDPDADRGLRKVTNSE